ncbi:MAG: hypothetical protein PVG19_12420, partial [Desulfobacterales bacterium]
PAPLQHLHFGMLPNRFPPARASALARWSGLTAKARNQRKNPDPYSQAAGSHTLFAGNRDVGRIRFRSGHQF